MGGMYDLKMGVMARGQGERYSVTYDYYSPSFYLIDLTSSHSFTLGDHNVSLGAGIENLLNWRDARPKIHQTLCERKPGSHALREPNTTLQTLRRSRRNRYLLIMNKVDV